MIIRPLTRYLETEEGYKLVFELGKNTEVIEDERLDGKYNGKRFSKVDRIGLPLFDENGERTWYARNNGLSRLYLGKSGSLNSDSEYLANSVVAGRVVLVSGEAVAQNFL